MYYNEQIAVQDADTLNNDIKKIISNRHFYVDLEELVSIIEPIKKAAENLGTDTLTPIKQKLGDDYSFAEIRAVISYMQWFSER